MDDHRDVGRRFNRRHADLADDFWKARNPRPHYVNAKPAIIPSMGGSICNDIFTDDLGIPAVWIPHSYASCSQHWPDEHILMPLSRSAIGLMAGLYWDIGSGNAPKV